MATSSILKSITIRDKKSGRKLVAAMSNSKKKSCQDVTLSKKYTELKGSEISKVFGNK